MISEFIVGSDLISGTIVDRTVDVELMGRKIHLLRCLTGDKGDIVMCRARENVSAMFEILAVSDDCKYFKPEHVGAYVWLPESPIGKETWCWRMGNAEIVAREQWWDDRDGPPLMIVGGKHEHQNP